MQHHHSRCRTRSKKALTHLPTIGIAPLVASSNHVSSSIVMPAASAKNLDIKNMPDVPEVKASFSVELGK